MGTLTEKFSDLSDLLQAEFRKAQASSMSGAGSSLVLNRLVRPMMPAAIRCSAGTVLDMKDREVGLFDVVGCSDAWPPIGDGAATSYLIDGVSFVIQARDWSVNDLTQFGEMAGKLKSLERSTKKPVFCGAVSFMDMPLQEITEFLKSASGQSVDGIIAIGSHVVIRNSRGLYGDPGRIPLVTERGRGEALKSFTFALVHAAQSFLDQPFGWASYQHL